MLLSLATAPGLSAGAVFAIGRPFVALKKSEIDADSGGILTALLVLSGRFHGGGAAVGSR